MGQSLTVQIAERVETDYIRSGSVPVGGRLPTVRSLVNLYGVSATTVAQGLSVLEARGLVDKQHGRGCFVLSPPMGAGDVRALGLVLPGDLDTGCLADVYSGVEAACRGQGCEVMVATCDFDLARERAHVARLLASGVEGIVLVPVTRRRNELQDDYLAQSFEDAAIVLVDNAYPEQGRCCVLFDNHRAGHAMTRALLDEGHRRIAFVDALTSSGEYVMHRSTRERRDGYIRALGDAGVVARDNDIVPAQWFSGPPSRELDELLRSWGRGPDQVTAVIALDDMNALEIIHAAREAGLSVPGDLRVAGFDNRRAGRAMRPPFPTTNPDFVRAGAVAVDLVLRILRGDVTDPVTYLLEAPLHRLEDLRAVAGTTGAV